MVSKVVYIADGDSSDVALSGLQATEADVAGALASGQLAMQADFTTYTRDGVFDPERMVQLLRQETEQALGEGHTALRVTGEMTWVELQLKGDLELVRAAGTEFRIRFPLDGPPRPREPR
jgi:hypothetical protein